MRKILIIGPGGAGKSTVARQLGAVLNIEVSHLDKLYWQPGWVESPKEEWVQTIEALMQRDSWILDGNYSGTLDKRLGACDTVIFLDMARLVCIARVFKRLMLYRNDTRPDMADGCGEHFNFEFIRWVWNYSRRTRPKVLTLLQANAQTKKIVWLRTRADVEKFLLTQKTERQAYA